MKQSILVAGATGDLGGRIIKALIERDAEVKALVRATADKTKIAKLEQFGAKVISINKWEFTELASACNEVSCVVSALQGLREVIIDGQSILVNAAISVGVPRFIPSDFASDLTKVAVGENRNFDLRKEFHAYLEKCEIQSTSILNGAFAEILRYNIPFLNFKNKTVGYFGSAEHRVDFTTMDNTASFTAEAALDPSAPRILRIAGIQVSANEMAPIASDIFHSEFKVINMGDVKGLSGYNRRERAAHPEGENEVFPNWQRSQYTHSMFTTELKPLDNNRYPDIKWTGIKEVLAAMA